MSGITRVNNVHNVNQGAQLAMKPGWKTSEFWLTITQQALALAVTVGAVGGIEAQTLQGTFAVAIPAAVGLVTSALTVIHYARGRVQQKLAGAPQG